VSQLPNKMRQIYARRLGCLLSPTCLQSGLMIATARPPPEFTGEVMAQLTAQVAEELGRRPSPIKREALSVEGLQQKWLRRFTTTFSVARISFWGRFGVATLLWGFAGKYVWLLRLIWPAPGGDGCPCRLANVSEQDKHEDAASVGACVPPILGYNERIHILLRGTARRGIGEDGAHAFSGPLSSHVSTSAIMNLTESQTRATLISPQLKAAEWELNGRSELRFEVFVRGYVVKLDNRLGLLGFLRHVLDMDGVPNYEAVPASGFQDHTIRDLHRRPDSLPPGCAGCVPCQASSGESRPLRSAADELWPQRRETLLHAKRDRINCCFD
jgi:hypothetical protein